MDGRIIVPRDFTKGAPTNPFLASITLSTDTQPSLPTVYGSATGVSVLPVTRSAGGTLVASSSAEGVAGAVSWQEYHRVCTNERTLMENVETLKALVLQLAAQLSQAQEEVQLLEQSLTSPQHVQRSCSSQETPGTAPETEVAAAASQEAARQELVDIIARKDHTIDALQQRMARQSAQFYMELDELARTKDAIIERLAVELDTLRCFKK